MTPISNGATTQGGTITLNSDGSFAYTPPSGFFDNVDTFDYTALTDGASDTATVSITVPNDPPVVNADNYTTTINTTLDIPAPGVLANDFDPQGTVITAIALVAATAQGGTVNLTVDGAFSYVPPADYTGMDSFVYTVTDGIDTNFNIVSLTVTANTAPIAINDTYTTSLGETLNILEPGVLENDIDAEDDELTAILSQNVTQGTLALNGDGSFIYIPDAVGSFTFTYFADDSVSTSDTAATVTINVIDPDSLPVRLYPADETVINAGTYEGPFVRFEHIAGVEWYWLWIGTDASSNFDQYFLFEWYPATDDSDFAEPGSGICDMLTNICTVPDPIWLVNDGFSWWMTTWSDGDTQADISSGWNETTFSFAFGVPASTVTYTSPADEAVVSPPTQITWNADPNAQWYRLWIGTADYTTQVYFDWVDGTEACTEGVCTLDVSGLTFADDDYEIWTEVWGPDGYVTWLQVNGGVPSAFTVDGSGAVPAIPRPTR